ncbi:MAG: HAMP domain-containing sensor histidine kinase [Nanoarchaeota archaeon]
MKKEVKKDNRDLELISFVSHEMRTPLASIRSMLQLNLEEKIGKINDKQKKSLSLAYENAKRLELIIKNMLEGSRTDESKIKYEFSDFDLPSSLSNIIKTAEVLMKEKKISAEIKNTKSLIINADKGRLEQVFLNLITNAVKYGNKNGHIMLSVKKKNSNALISFKDDGIGIPKEKIPNLFTKMFQVSPGSTKSMGGIGLGLFISKKIVEKHNGKIWVESEIGKGSTFYISIPLKQKNP